MMAQLRALLDRMGFKSGVYPRQFWILFWGMLFSTIGMSMVWPFLVVYVSGKLDMPLTAVAGLFTLSSAASLISSLIAGPIIDRLGRKWAMVISLVINGLGYFLLGFAQEYLTFAVLMTMNGFVNPLYRISADAMMADLVEPARRADGYSLMRMSHNLGIAVGPATGGFLAAISYSITFTIAAVSMALYALFIAILARETLPEEARIQSKQASEPLGGYGKVLSDKPFTGMVIAFAIVQVCSSLIWILLAVYAKDNYGIPENLYGWLPTTNALLVVTLQIMVTQVVKRYSPLKALSLGAFLYGLANLIIAVGSSFWAFWISMVVMTLGELILVPTSSTYVANLAPAAQRARYMSIYGLTWTIAAGIAPVIGGMLNDNFNPHAIWYGGSLAGLAAVFAFLVLQSRYPSRPQGEENITPQTA